MMCFVWRGRFGNKPLLREINGQPMGRKSTTPLISLSASLLAVWFKLEDEGCHHFKCPMFARGLPLGTFGGWHGCFLYGAALAQRTLKPHTAYSMKVLPSWNAWMILAPMARLNIPKTGKRWRVAFWAIVVTRVQANDWSTYSSGNQWEINPYSWWLNQPLWKICSSHWESFPQKSGWT